MDPNKTLAELRRLTDTIHTGYDADSLTDLSLDLADYFHDLDAWLSKGGFLPKDWQHQRASLVK